MAESLFSIIIIFWNIIIKSERKKRAKEAEKINRHFVILINYYHNCKEEKSSFTSEIGVICVAWVVQGECLLIHRPCRTSKWRESLKVSRMDILKRIIKVSELHCIAFHEIKLSMFSVNLNTCISGNSQCLERCVGSV